jgi:biopolymer transport protein ExbD
MKIRSPLPHKKARIEIIPLIDIMFFLLASFMMASLSMMKLESVSMELPSATTARRELKPDIVNIGVDRAGEVYIDKSNVNLVDLRNFLSNKFRVNTNVPVFLSGDKEASHASIVRVLESIRFVGIQQVSFSIAPAAAPPQP